MIYLITKFLTTLKTFLRNYLIVDRPTMEYINQFASSMIGTGNNIMLPKSAGNGHLPAGIYLSKVNNINNRTRCEICSKLTIQTPERHWRRSGIFIVNREHISHLALVFLLLTLNM